MQSSLVDYGNIAGLASINYWSSTEVAGYPILFVFLQQFGSGGSSYQVYTDKPSALAVRCARAITN